jgi:hypothetical protein
MTGGRADVLTRSQLDLLRELHSRLEQMSGALSPGTAVPERDEWRRIRSLAQRCLVECAWPEAPIR